MKNIINFAVTSLGTVAVEYPSLGIPSLSAAGDSYYNIFGFSLKPKNQNEYFSYLRKLDEIPKPTLEQINNAKIFTFVQFSLTKIIHPFLADYPVTRFDHKTEENFWIESKRLIQNYEIENDKFMKMFKHQYINNNRDFINLEILKSN